MHPETSRSLLILGATARAAAQSARRAGFQVHAADLFSDVDLCAVAPAQSVRNYPNALESLAREKPPMDWIYTGALENHPALVERISHRHRLLGSDAATLVGVRDPKQFFAVVEASACCLAPWSTDPVRVPVDGSWLWKPRRSGGGMQIRPWKGTASTGRSLEMARQDAIYQQRIEGTPVGAVFVGAGQRAVLLGISRQLVGFEATHAGEFQYAGSIGPLELDVAHRAALADLGTRLAAQFQLRGLFGVDAMVNSRGVWPLEVNPRYTASVEVLERALGLNMIRLHVEACLSGRLPVERIATNGRMVGKAVVFATARTKISTAWSQAQLQRNATRTWPLVADIPQPGTVIPQGSPITTLFDEADDQETLLARLERRIAQCRQSLAATLEHDPSGESVP
jgi:predicted ATP-grasp superfamily ATP-dependent carboligase